MQMLTAGIDSLEQNGTRSPSAASGAAASISTEIEHKILELEKQFANMMGSTRECKAVVGGLGDFGDLDTAVQFIRQQVNRYKSPEPADYFARGEFSTILFTKFGTVDARDKLVNAFGRSQIKHNNNVAWTRADQPIDKGVPESFLFGLRKLFLDWGHSKGEVRVDTTECKLTIAKDPVVTVKTVNNAIQISWNGPWANWEELTSSQEVQHLTGRANDALNRAAKGNVKGMKGGKPE
eukprot:1293781-Pyramimonas_sp.AAC.1